MTVAGVMLALCAALYVLRLSRRRQREHDQFMESIEARKARIAGYDEHRANDYIYGGKRTIDVAPAVIPINSGGGTVDPVRRPAHRAENDGRA